MTNDDDVAALERMQARNKELDGIALARLHFIKIVEIERDEAIARADAAEADNARLQAEVRQLQARCDKWT